MGKCKLCLENKRLSDSHIIPRSFFIKLKKGTSQLIRLVGDLTIAPRMDNANWNEPLLCGDCEHLINKCYETPQLTYLRNYKKVIKSKKKITFQNFNYLKFYLLWLSVIWRASESSLEAYNAVALSSTLNERLRLMIFHGTTIIDGVDYAESIKIGIARIIPGPGMTDLTKQILTPPAVDMTHSGIVFYMMLEGFLITYIFANSSSPNLPKDFGEIKPTSFLRVPCVPALESKYARIIYSNANIIAHAHPSWK